MPALSAREVVVCPWRVAVGRAAVFLTVAVMGSRLDAQRVARGSPAITAYVAAHQPEILQEFSTLLAIPNVAADSAHIRENAALIVAMLERRGVTARVLPSPTGGAPAVYGVLLAPGAARTVVLYAHYDGQPADSSQWTGAPWTPVLRDGPLNAGGQQQPLPTSPGIAQNQWLLYARSASDDKGSIMAILAALDALKATGARPSVNLKFFFEGEEEAGSAHTRALLEQNASLLAADGWVFGDGPVHQSGRLQLVFGARGAMGLDMTVYGPARALHSGHYGNWAPNPIVLLANLLASMRDDEGRIRIAGFSADVVAPTAIERRALAAVPSMDSALRVELALGRTEAGNANLAARLLLPALNLRGIQGGHVGALETNSIPTSATASIDFRLVPRQTPAHVRELVEAHLRRQGYFVVHDPPDPATRRAHARVALLEWEAGYPSVREPLDLPFGRALSQAIAEATGTPPLAIPTLGGSLPLFDFHDVLKVPVMTLPIANYDDNQHAANENIRLENLWNGIVVYAGVMANLGSFWR